MGFDQDEEAMANVPNDERFVFVRHNFRFLKNFLKYHGIEQIDGLLADLGVSSHHFDSRITSYNVCYTKLLRSYFSESLLQVAYGLQGCLCPVFHKQMSHFCGIF